MDNGKENGNCYSIMGYIFGLYRDNGKESGNYYSIMGYILWYILGYISKENGKDYENYYNGFYSVEFGGPPAPKGRQ